MSVRLSSWESPSVPACASQGAGIKSPPLHLIRPKTFSESRREPYHDYPLNPLLQPSPPRASFLLLQSEKHRRSSAISFHLYTYECVDIDRCIDRNAYTKLVQFGCDVWFPRFPASCELLCPSLCHSCILSAVNHSLYFNPCDNSDTGFVPFSPFLYDWNQM